MTFVLTVRLGLLVLGLVVFLEARVVIVGIVGALSVGVAEGAVARPLHNLVQAQVGLALLAHNLVDVGDQQGVAGVPELLLGGVGDLVADAVLELVLEELLYGRSALCSDHKVQLANELEHVPVQT